MAQYSEQDLKLAAEFREQIHKEALEKVRQTCPEIDAVVDRYPVEAYFQQNWDYPGRWYTIVAVPAESQGRARLIDTIVRDTLARHSGALEAAPPPGGGKRIDAKHYAYEKLFTVSVDQKARSCILVGRDALGRFILESYEEYNLGSATDSVSAYYVMTDAEYRRYALKALENGHITEADYARLRAPVADGADGAVCPDDPFYDVIAGYPRCVVEYCIVAGDPRRIQGMEEHRRALAQACRKLLADDPDDPDPWLYDVSRAQGRRIDAAALFAPMSPEDRLNYRRAFLAPPQGSGCTDADFDRVNAALFPNGTEGLEVYEWTTDWSDYFDDGHEWWGALCLTVYDSSLHRFAVILASATD